MARGEVVSMDRVTEETVTRLKRLREPFPPEAVGKLTRKNNKTGTTVKLDYVGHAAVTDRLLQADPFWTWEPVAWSEQGLPQTGTDVNGNLVLWIKLTVCGVTRLGVGTVEKSKSDPVKELIGDALRNAAMRFGVALDLWSKEDLQAQAEHAEALTEAKGPTDPEPAEHANARPPAPMPPITSGPLAAIPKEVAVQVIELMGRPFLAERFVDSFLKRNGGDVSEQALESLLTEAKAVRT